MNRLWMALAPLLLTGCPGDGGGGGGPAACTSLNTGRSYIDSNCVGCTISNAGDVADGSLYSFADINLTDFNSQALIRVGNGGTVLPAGTRAGAFVTRRVDLAQGVNGNPITLRTYLAGAPAETALVDIDDTRGGTDAETFVSFETTAPFDAVEIEIGFTNAEHLSTADVRVYEICSNGHI